MTGTTWEAKAPRALFERLASQLSAHGYDYESSPGRSYGAETPCDVALALSIAANGNEVGFTAFWARWMGDRSAMIDLALLIHREGENYAPTLIAGTLSAVASAEYCHGRMTPYEMETSLPGPVFRRARKGLSVPFKHKAPDLKAFIKAHRKHERAMSDRRLAKVLNVSRTHTVPEIRKLQDRYRKAYDEMLHKAYRAESRLGAAIRPLLADV